MLKADSVEVYETMPAEEIAKLCESLDCDLVVADDTTLLLDLDTPEALLQFNRNWDVVATMYKVRRTERWLSRNGNTHIVVRLIAPLEDWPTRLLIQAALGSDGKREMFSLNRYLEGHETPSVLFKPRQTPTFERVG